MDKNAKQTLVEVPYRPHGMGGLSRSPQLVQEALARVLVEIRGIASQASGSKGHAPTPGSRSFGPNDAFAALTAIYVLADAAHNLPDTGRPEFLVDSGLQALAKAGQDIYGQRSPFPPVRSRSTPA